MAPQKKKFKGYNRYTRVSSGESDKILASIDENNNTAKEYCNNVQKVKNKKQDALKTIRLVNSLNIMIQKKKAKEKLVRFLHAACCLPVASTFIKATEKGNFLGWPGLTADSVQKNLSNNLATELGHIRQEYAGLQSTRQVQTSTPTEKWIKTDDYDYMFPTPDLPNVNTRQVIYVSEEILATGLGYTDLTGKFTYTSSRGNCYILIAYCYNGSAILAQPVKDRSAGSLTNA